MAVTAERFEQGMTYDEFKQVMTRNRERLEQNERALELSAEDRAAFSGLARPVHVLAIAEDWCGDVIDNLPILARIAQDSGKLNVRVFLRDQNPDLIDQYLKEGQFRSIPVFAFFDDEFRELGHFIERPESVTERRAQTRATIYAQHPELGSPETPVSQLPEEPRTLLMQELATAREASKAADNLDVVRALRQIVEQEPAA